MGIMNHNAILVTSELRHATQRIREWVAGRPADEQTLFVEAGPFINGATTFILAPDGSKEGWGESDRGDRIRQEFVEWLTEQHTTADLWVNWVEVGYGEYGQTVLRGNNTNKHDDQPYAKMSDVEGPEPYVYSEE